jgi:hypothetical protein
MKRESLEFDHDRIGLVSQCSDMISADRQEIGLVSQCSDMISAD